MAYTTINKYTAHFNVKLYTGNGSSNAQTGVGFQPDLFWTKSRTNGEHNTIIDSVRGVNKGIYANTDAAEFTGTNFGSFDSDGFTWSGNLGSGNEKWYKIMRHGIGKQVEEQVQQIQMVLQHQQFQRTQQQGVVLLNGQAQEVLQQ